MEWWCISVKMFISLFVIYFGVETVYFIIILYFGVILEMVNGFDFGTVAIFI